MLIYACNLSSNAFFVPQMMLVYLGVSKPTKSVHDVQWETDCQFALHVIICINIYIYTKQVQRLFIVIVVPRKAILCYIYIYTYIHVFRANVPSTLHLVVSPSSVQGQGTRSGGPTIQYLHYVRALPRACTMYVLFMTRVYTHYTEM